MNRKRNLKAVLAYVGIISNVMNHTTPIKANAQVAVREIPAEQIEEIINEDRTLADRLTPYEVPVKQPVREIPKEDGNEEKDVFGEDEDIDKKEKELQRKEEELKKKEEELKKIEEERLEEEQRMIEEKEKAEEERKFREEQKQKEEAFKKRLEEINNSRKDKNEGEEEAQSDEGLGEERLDNIEEGEEEEIDNLVDKKDEPSQKINKQPKIENKDKKKVKKKKKVKVLDRGQVPLILKESEPIKLDKIDKQKLSPIYKEDNGSRKQYFTKLELANLIYHNTYLDVKHVGAPYKDLYDTDAELQATLVSQHGIMIPNSYIEFGLYDLVTWGDLKRAVRKIDRLKRYKPGDIFYNPFNRIEHLPIMRANKNLLPTKTNIVDIMEKVIFEGRDLQQEALDYLNILENSGETNE